MNRTLEETFTQLLKEAEKGPLSIEEIIRLLSGRGLPMILILFIIPFCQPIQIPGLSTPFGFLVIFIGLRMAFGHHILLPQFILAKKVSRDVLIKVVQAASWVNQKAQNFTAIRLAYLSENPVVHVLNGVLIAILGVVLALPLPIPFSNMLVSWPILLISFGMTEDDGLFICLGYLLIAVCVGFFLALFLLFQHYI